eukprot:36348_1
MFWEGQPESLTVQFLQYIDWKTKVPPPPLINDELISAVGTVDIVGLHLLTHILKEYYFEMCHVLTLELDLEDLTHTAQLDQNSTTDPQQQMKKAVTESVLIVTKLCSVICKMPKLQSLHLSLNHFPQQCYTPCIQMFNLGVQNPNKDAPELKDDHHGYLFHGGSDVFPSLQQLFLNSSIFYLNEANDDFIISTPINDYNCNITDGCWSDNDHKDNINIEQLMTDYNIGDTDAHPINNHSADDWQCATCTLINDGRFMECNACGEPRQIGKGNNKNLGNTPQNEFLVNVYDDDDAVDDEKLLTMDDDEKSAYFPFISFLSAHDTLKSVSIHIDKRGKNGISLVNRILLSIAKRKKNLESFYIDCGALHLNYCIKYLILCIKKHSFRRFSCHFFAVDERSVSKMINEFNANPHPQLSFLSIDGNGVQTASQTIGDLITLVEKYKDLEYLKLCYFTGVSCVGDNWLNLMRSLLKLQTLCFVSFGQLLIDNNEVIQHLCQFVWKCTTLQSIDISISQKSYEGHGGSLENTKKFIFYTFKNQIFLQEQIEETQGCLICDWKMPSEIVDLVIGFTFDFNGRFNININGLPEGDMSAVGTQFIKLKNQQSRKWTIGRDVQLFTHL